MNSTTGQTKVTITTAQPKPQSTLQKRVIYNARGKGRQIEKLRGIQI